jgi:hypothetical protein
MNGFGKPADDRITKALQRLACDCGCPDVYYCPSSEDIECPRDSGFDVCCDRTREHVPVR